jgi:hypothetical protein
MPEPAPVSHRAAPGGPEPTGERRTELPEVGLVLVLSLALVGYVYAIGWVIACVRLAAVRLPVSFSLPSIGSAANFATGAQAVLVMAIVFAVMCAFAYAVHFRRWDQHADEWREILERDRTSARERYLRRQPLKPKPPKAVRAPYDSRAQETLARVIAGFNVGVLAVAVGLVGGRLAKTVIDQLSPGHWWALLAPWAACSIVLAWLLALVSPLKGGRMAHALLWLVVAGVAFITSAPLGLLVLTWIGIGTLGRRYGGRALPGSTFAFLRSPLPWALLTIYALVALCYSATPPVSFSQTIVETRSGRRLGGYLGRTASGVYLASCTPLADATSYEDRVQVIPASAIRSTTATNGDFTLDTGYRPSLPTLALRAFGIDTQTVAWIRPELKERSAPCAGTPPPRPSVDAVADPGLGPGVYAGLPQASGVARDGEAPIEVTTKNAPRIAMLAKRLQPTVLTSVTDPFWPISLTALLEDIGSDGQRACVHPSASRRACPPGSAATVATLNPARSSPGDFLEYPVTPALTHTPTKQLEAFLRGQLVRETPLPSPRETLADPGILDPWATAQVYFFYAGPAGKLKWPVPYPAGKEKNLLALEYWFLYPYNYFPTDVSSHLMEDAPIAGDVVNTDLHQGDWEHVVVLAERESGRPRWLYMARHSSEGKFFPWDSAQLSFEGGHPIVQAAYGGHPTYPAGCGARPRYLKPIDGRLADWLVCGPGRFAFRASTTPLVDLAHTTWACWQGHFGVLPPGAVQTAAQSTSAIVRTLARELESYVYVPGPRSPLWQAENGHLQAEDGPHEHKPSSGPCLLPEGPATFEHEAEREGSNRSGRPGAAR